MSRYRRVSGIPGIRAGRLSALRFLAPGFGFLTDLAITKLIGLDGLGRYAIITSVAALASIAISLGMQAPLNRELAVAEQGGEKAKLTMSSLAASTIAWVLVAAALVAFDDTVLSWFNAGELRWEALYIVFIAGGLAFQSLAVSIGRGFDRLTLATVTELLASKLVLLAGLALIAIGLVPRSLPSVLLTTVVAVFAPLVVTLAWLAKRDGLRPTAPDLGLSQRLSFQSWALLGHQVVFTISASIAMWVLDRSDGNAAVGVFYLVTRLAAFISILAVVVQFLYGNQIAAAHRGRSLDALEPHLRSVVTKATTGALVVLGGIFLVHRVFLRVLTGEPTTSETTLAFVLLAVGQLVQVGTGPSGYTLIMAKRESSILTSTAIGAIVTTVAALVLTSRYGIVGAAAATALGQIIINVINLGLARRVVGLNTATFLNPRSAFS